MPIDFRHAAPRIAGIAMRRGYFADVVVASDPAIGTNWISTPDGTLRWVRDRLSKNPD